MSGFKKIACFLLIFCLTVSVFPPTVAQAQANALPQVSAEAAVLIEADSGNVVFAKNSDKQLPMASTTKIATAMTALALASCDTVITVSPDAVGIEGSSVYLTAGEQLSLEQLLYALLLESANDAATAIAVGLSGSVSAFAEQMNEQAKSLGLNDTHFINPHGLDDEQHYTTAYDLALLTKKALENEHIRTIVGTRKTTIPHATEGAVRLLINHNKLLRLYEGCIGVKTGFTKRSGRCLVSAAERDGVTMIAVTLNASNDWNDHSALLDYGFSLYESVLLCEREAYLFPLPVVGGNDGYVMLANDEALRITLPKSHGEIVATVEVQRFAYAPVAEGETIGNVVFRCDTDRDGKQEIIASTALNACYGVLQKSPKKGFLDWIRSLFFH